MSFSDKKKSTDYYQKVEQGKEFANAGGIPPLLAGSQAQKDFAEVVRADILSSLIEFGDLDHALVLADNIRNAKDWIESRYLDYDAILERAEQIDRRNKESPI